MAEYDSTRSGTELTLADVHFDSPTLLGIAAVLSAIGGIISTTMAVLKKRSEDEEECRKRLKEARAEAESLAAELHQRKIQNAE